MNSLQNLVACRYNRNHKLKPGKLVFHEDKCPDKKNVLLKVCPFNPVHKVSPENYEKHKRDCSQKPEIDHEAEKELKEYLKNKSINRDTNSIPWQTVNDSLPIGLRPSNEREKEEKEIKHLVNEWEMIESVEDINKLNVPKSEDEDKTSSQFDNFYRNEYDPNEALDKIKRNNKNNIIDESDEENDEDEQDDLYKSVYKNK